MMHWYRILGLVCAMVIVMRPWIHVLLEEMPSSIVDRSELVLTPLRKRLTQQLELTESQNDIQQQSTRQESIHHHNHHHPKKEVYNDGPLPLKVEELCPRPKRKRRSKQLEFDKQESNQGNNNSSFLSASDFIEQETTPRAVIFHFPSADFGLLCNVLHQVSNGLDVAMTFPDQSRKVIFALEIDQSVQIQTALDIDMLVKGVNQVSKLDLRYLGIKEPLRDIQVILDWKASEHNERARKRGHLILEFSVSRLMRMRRNENSIAMTYFLRPHFQHRQKAEQVVKDFRDKHPNEYLVSIHRRVFTWCTKIFKLHAPFCSKRPDWDLFAYFDDTCNVTMSPELIRRTAQEFLGREDFSRPFSLFMASDLHDLAGDATFYEWAERNGRVVLSIPHQENPEHVVSLAWSKSDKPESRNRLNLTVDELKEHKDRYKHIKDFISGQFDGFNMNWDMSMLTDMHAQTLSDYAIGQPFSSCDRILALWRSLWGKAAFSAYLESNNEWDVNEFKRHLRHWDRRLGHSKFHQIYPKSCYEPFDHPKHGEYTLLNRMERWWKTHEEWWLNGTTTEKIKVPSSDGAVSGIQAILPPILNSLSRK